MITISPAILAKDEQDLLQKADIVRKLGLIPHIDVMDGIFVNNTAFAPLDRMHHLLDGMRFEVHLMVNDPEHAVPEWLAGGASRVYFHVETTNRESMICRATAADCAKLALVINPDTPISAVEPFLDIFHRVLVMGVNPGWGGQAMHPSTIEKIRELKRRYPPLGISVDGGVKPENAAALVNAGADTLIAGSAIIGAPDPAAALAKFRMAVEQSG